MARWRRAAGPAGFLPGAVQSGADAVLLQAQTLAAQASFDVDGLAYTSDGNNRAYDWALLADGGLYAAASSAVDDSTYPAQRSRLARFAVPGYPAADRIF
ncbi:hypothetical protein DFR29_111150 [Tahibacter aquaticus]|uniref:Uncharacterized protein n=1 Tax=Tahibacter aquaticus TaxID=520092 RepID=A0A4R6YSU6_9GAMM|nr:hypothetical protein [Tahibacter aquaticus]TDR41236.1 hypothetical protein DFR29_111150 [Tahibacter aquaticus]